MLNTAIDLTAHISLLLCIGMIIVIKRKCQSSQIRTAFLIILGVMIFWNVGTLLEADFRMATGNTYMPFIYFCYIGIIFTPIAILYLGKIILQSDWNPKPVHAAFLIVPFISVVVMFTSPLHNLFFVHFSLNSSEAVYGTYYYFHALYSYACIAAGIILMIIASIRNSGIFSMQSMFVISGIVITGVPNVLYSFGVGHLPFSISAAAFTISLFCFSTAFLKYRFITSLPITTQQVIDLVSDGYLVVDKQLCILSYNRALLHMSPEPLNITLGENLRPYIEKFLLDAPYDRFLELYAQSTAQQMTVSMEERILGGRYVRMEITPVLKRSAQTGSIILFKDITQSRLLIEATQSASRAKSDFLSHMSHEIRTPLTAIIGMINIGIGSDDVDKIKYCLDRADKASKHLLGIVNNILDISKIEANMFELSLNSFNFEQMLMNIVDVSNVRAEEKQQNLVVNIGKDVPIQIECDELRLSQIITNLLTNAIKFTPEKGTVTLSIDKTEETRDEAVLRIEVADTGIGISKAQQERIFASFSQADPDITQKFGGTGLGLAISKRIIELMDGSIWVESELDQGAKFVFTVKVKKLAAKPRARLAANIRPENVRILAVDDSKDVRDYFIHVMEVLKLQCDVAGGGMEALDMIRNAGNKQYTIFFVDWLMPDMNGIELTKKIKEINGENSIVILISMADWNIIEKEAVAAGVKHFVSKPLFPSALINAINICIGVEFNETADDGQVTLNIQQYDFYNHTLLIVEDVEINREIMAAILGETKISVDYAVNGEKAVSMFCENPDKYSLILMDINMPVMNGYEATRQIRALNTAQSKDVPIVAMTANVFKEDIEKCRAAGMNGHIGKPINSAALFELLNNFLGQTPKTPFFAGNAVGSPASS